MPDDNDPSGSDDSEGFYDSEYTDRKRGILTKNDREYLLGKKEISGQDERNLRYRMRQRVLQSLLDIELLALAYDDDELEKIFQDDQFPAKGVITATLRLAYRMSRHRFDDVHDELARQLHLVIFDENTEHWVDDNVPIASFAHVSVDISIENDEYSLPGLVRGLVANEADKWSYQHLNDIIEVDYDEDWMDELLEEEGWVTLQPPGVDEEMKFHPLIADYIKAAQKG